MLHTLAFFGQAMPLKPSQLMELDDAASSIHSWDTELDPQQFARLICKNIVGYLRRVTSQTVFRMLCIFFVYNLYYIAHVADKIMFSIPTSVHLTAQNQPSIEIMQQLLAQQVLQLGAVQTTLQNVEKIYQILLELPSTSLSDAMQIEIKKFVAFDGPIKKWMATRKLQSFIQKCKQQAADHLCTLYCCNF